MTLDGAVYAPKTSGTFIKQEMIYHFIVEKCLLLSAFSVRIFHKSFFFEMLCLSNTSFSVSLFSIEVALVDTVCVI